MSRLRRNRDISPKIDYGIIPFRPRVAHHLTDQSPEYLLRLALREGANRTIAIKAIETRPGVGDTPLKGCSSETLRVNKTRGSLTLPVVRDKLRNSILIGSVCSARRRCLLYLGGENTPEGSPVLGISRTFLCFVLEVL